MGNGTFNLNFISSGKNGGFDIHLLQNNIPRKISKIYYVAEMLVLFLIFAEFCNENFDTKIIKKFTLVFLSRFDMSYSM